MEKQEYVALIADDDPLIRDIINKALSDICKIVQTGDGKEVLEVYKKCQPNVVFLDVHFPGANGFELVPKIKEFDPNAYIVMLTSDSTEGNVAKAICEGASGFIAKPFKKQTLIDSLNRCPTMNPDVLKGVTGFLCNV